MQPDDNEPMISGDVQNTQFVQTGMQPQPQTVIIDPMTGLPQNVIMIQQPSAGPKVVGILVIIWGVFSILGEVYSIGQTLSMGSIFIASSILSLGISAGFIVGGVMMTNYQMRGVQISLAMIVVSTIVGLAMFALMPDLLDDLADEEDLTAEEREELDEYGGVIMGVGAIFTVICNGICGLIIAIPLMISNNGLDKSSLFS
tara:strand:- start:223 stop:825 length:603 start_codon:yes stop_codon:yes gene_type:complete